MYRNVSKNRSELLRRLKRNVISFKYAGKCLVLTLCHEPMMPRFKSENALSIELV